MQGYFAYMLTRSPSTDWLGALRNPPDAAALATLGEMPRNMWCTAGFLHASGRTVTVEGDIVPLAEAGDQAVFSFDSIKAVCADDGIVRWEPADTSQPARFIFHVRNRERYAAAMTRAMCTLLATLP
jgi:hypothetical protein